MAQGHFTPELFTFLRDLKRHNRRDWFLGHKERYERDVRGPCLRFVQDCAAPLARVSAHVVADPRPVGGSLFRIQRDTRFAKDKSPYKTHTGIQFRHGAGRDVHGPCYYLHLAPGEVFLGAGVWHPEPDALLRLRRALADDPKGFTRALGGRALLGTRLAGEQLQRVPRGFDPEHPLADHLRRKDFVLVRESTEADVLAPAFLRDFVSFCRAAAPFNRFLARALDLDF